MSQHWSSPLDDYTQEYHVLEVPQELLSELSDNISAGIQRCRQRESAELIKVGMFLSSLDRVVTSMGDVHTTVCVQDQADGNSIKCSSTIDICNLLLWEWQSRGKCTDIAITLVMKAWLDIDIGSEFHVFVLDSAIRAIFQRKTARDKMSMEQRKKQLSLLKHFLRGTLPDIQLEHTYMLNLFIDHHNKLWVLNAVPAEGCRRPSSADWVEMPSSRPSSGVLSKDGVSRGMASGSSSPAAQGHRRSTAESNSSSVSLTSPVGTTTTVTTAVGAGGATAGRKQEQSTQSTATATTSGGPHSPAAASLSPAAVAPPASPFSPDSAAPSTRPPRSPRRQQPLTINPEAVCLTSTATTTGTTTAAATKGTYTHLPSPSSARTPAALYQEHDVDSPCSVQLSANTEGHALPSFMQERYSLGPVLGKGGYAFVREGVDKHTGDKVAVKILHRVGVKQSAELQIRKEVNILAMLSHPNIVRTFAFYEEPDYFYTVLECINGGALFDRLKLRTVFTEGQVRALAYVLLSALQHCHDRHVVHRDLKPENLIMTSGDSDADLKIVDFGFAAIDTGGCTLTDRCGTPMYVAPEILQKIPHGKPVDMWSFGVVLFLLLSGDAPFKDPNVKSLYAKIKSGVFHFKSHAWRDVSAPAADLVKSLLVTSQLHRPTVLQALAHPWFQMSEEELSCKHLHSTLESLRSFQAAQRFRKGVNAVRAVNRMKIQHQLTRSEYIEAMNRYPRDISARYELGEILGRGGYAVVWSAVSRLDKRDVAIKKIALAGLKPSTEAGIRREAEILRHLHHRNIVKSYDFVDSDSHLYVVLERIDGGELFDRIVQKKCYSEKEARDLAVVILRAIKHCHDRKIVHRDLKPENLLMTGRDDSADLKLVDFGFAARVEGFSLTNQCGTPAYVAPEIIRKHPHGLPVDMWSFGVILYILLCGYPPFRDKAEKQLFMKIRAGVYEFHAKYWDRVSDDAKDLIRRLLVVNPVERYTVDDALAHAWVHADARQLSSYDLSESLSELELFQAGRHFKAGVNVIMAIHKMSKSRLFDDTAASEASLSALSSPVPAIGGVSASSGAAAPSPAKRMSGLLLQAAVTARDRRDGGLSPDNFTPDRQQQPQSIGVFSPDSRKHPAGEAPASLHSPYQQQGSSQRHVGAADPSVVLPTPPRAGSLQATIQKQRVLRQGDPITPIAAVAVAAGSATTPPQRLPYPTPVSPNPTGGSANTRSGSGAGGRSSSPAGGVSSKHRQLAQRASPPGPDVSVPMAPFSPKAPQTGAHTAAHVFAFADCPDTSAT